MEAMADNVLGEEDRLWIESKRETIEKFASGNWAGDIPYEDRQNYHRIAQSLIGFGFMVCWTCGNSIKIIGNYIKNSTKWQ